MTALLRSSLGDLSILSGSLRLPTGRAWSGVVDVHSAVVLAAGAPASVVLRREDGTEDVFAGIVRKSALNDGRADLSVTVVGGAGGLAGTVPARDYTTGATPVPAGLLARRICDDAGETLAPGVEAALDALTVPHWHRVEGPASAALDLLASLLGLSWRLTPSGLVWMGVDAWPAGPELRRLGFELEDGARRYGPDGAEVLPGQTTEGIQVVDVLYELGGPVRATARATVPGDPPHRPDVELYGRTWGARVVAQDGATGYLDVICDDGRIGELRGVPLRSGIPGARIVYQAPAGERVRLAFEAVDPRLPYAMPAHDQAPAGATVHGVVRVGDTGAGGALSGVADLTTGDVTFTYQPPQGGPPSTGTLVTLSTQARTGSAEVQIR